MKHHQHAVSEDMYHRVYRLMIRDTDPRLIAAALHLPLRTVLNVTARLKKNQGAGVLFEPLAIKDLKKAVIASFLDVYFLAKTRYAILQLVGCVTKDHADTLESELQKVRESAWKAIAIRLTDVTAMDDTGARQLIDLCETMKERERFVAFLDPSPDIEQQIDRVGFEKTIPIFGTERAFEDGAFSRRRAASQKRVRH
ncbi:MAG: anti-sigma factor antagonist [Chitinispirillaceae bacterium]|nr:anti-sigma factor antagonist [Chitinispirillaceae bacterium]